MLQILNLSALAAIMLLTGLRVSVGEVLSSLAEKHLLLLGLLANYLLVPLVTVALLCAFHANPMVSMGFLILAVCPGAPIAAPLTDLAHGNVPLAVGLMIVLAASSALLSPALIVILSSVLSLPPNLHIDYFGIIRLLLVAQLLPLAIGLSLRHWFPKFSGLLIKPLAVISLLLFIAVAVFVLMAQFEFLAAIKLRGWLGMSLLMMATLVLGGICGGRDKTSQRTLGLVTVSRNAGVGLVIALNNFSGTPAVSSLVVYSLFSIAASVLLTLIFRRSAQSLKQEIHSKP